MEINRKLRVTSYVLSGLVIAFMILDGTMKLLVLPIVLKSTADLGYPASVALIRGLGIIGLLSTLLYALPRTSILGAVLLTGYFGGAIASHVRIGNPLFTHVLFGVYLGMLAWAGLYLRDERLRGVFPIRSEL